MRRSTDKPARGKITITLAVSGILSMVAVGALLITVVKQTQSVDDNPETAAVSASPEHATPLSEGGNRPPPFRFPDPQQSPGNRKPEWLMLGALKPGDNNHDMITGSMQHRTLHFTFDDGPREDSTPELLNALSAYNVRATFFVVGSHLFGPDAQANRDLLRRTRKEGHTVAIHSYTHRDFRYLSAAQINRELYRSGKLLETILGYHPGLFRPPYGGRSRRTESLLHVRGYTEILWNIAPEEYSAKSPHEILGNFQAALDRQELNGQWPGGIVLLHDNRPQTVKGFPLLMEELRRRNCILLHQDGQELWDVVDDLSYFLLYGDQLPGELVTRRQGLARTAAAGYCNGRAPEKDQVTTGQYVR